MARETRVDRLGRPDLEAFVRELMASGRAPRSVARIVAACGASIASCCSTGTWLRTPPTTCGRRGRGPRFRGSCAGLLSLPAARRARGCDLHLDAGYLTCLGKGDKERLVPIGSAAVEWVRRYQRSARSALLGPRTSARVRGRRLRPAALVRICSSAALDQPVHSDSPRARRCRPPRSIPTQRGTTAIGHPRPGVDRMPARLLYATGRGMRRVRAGLSLGEGGDDDAAGRVRHVAVSPTARRGRTRVCRSLATSQRWLLAWKMSDRQGGQGTAGPDRAARPSSGCVVTRGPPLALGFGLARECPACRDTVGLTRCASGSTAWRSSAAMTRPSASAVRSTCLGPTASPASSSSRVLASLKLTRAAAAAVTGRQRRLAILTRKKLKQSYARQAGLPRDLSPHVRTACGTRSRRDLLGRQRAGDHRGLRFFFAALRSPDAPRSGIVDLDDLRQLPEAASDSDSPRPARRSVDHGARSIPTSSHERAG